MQIFKDHTLDEKYQHDGYVVVNFFDEAEVNHFLDFWRKSPHDFKEGKFTSVFSWPAELNVELSDMLKVACQPKIDQLMPGWYVEGGTYIVKGPASDIPTDFKLHQDYNMVNEDYAPSFGLWIALVDIDAENGGLFVLPGSHNKFKGTIRGVNIPSLQMPVDYHLEKIIKNINVKAGQACIFDHSLFHGSPSNSSLTERPIIHTGVFSLNSKSYHYVKVDDHIEVIEFERSYYYQNTLDFFKDPKSSPHRVVEILDQYRPSPTPEEVLDAYNLRTASNKKVFNLINSFFKRKS